MDQPASSLDGIALIFVASDIYWESSDDVTDFVDFTDFIDITDCVLVVAVSIVGHQEVVPDQANFETLISLHFGFRGFFSVAHMQNL